MHDDHPKPTDQPDDDEPVNPALSIPPTPPPPPLPDFPELPPKPGDKPAVIKKKDVSDLGRALSVVTNFLIAFGFFIGVGFIIDRTQATTPTWTLVGAGIGLVGGLYIFVKDAMRLDKGS